ncbi:MAG: NAD-dependent succinate-semialdehyde dehydrogenase [Sphingomonadales bacterium]|nr:NAD-dependent succinate-semialdehyde dehydrogenase [Sphingomonadales bacterium]
MIEAIRLIESALAGADGLHVANPATGEAIATVRAWSTAEVAGAIARADRARAGWAALTASGRAEVLRKWYELILANEAVLAEAVTAEAGKPLAEALAEVRYGAAYVQWFAEEGRRANGEVIPTFANDRRVLTIRQGVGTCTAITPWNFPVAMVTRKAAPALAAGCAIVVKPAEATPISALALEWLGQRAGLPEGLFAVTPTGDPAGVGRVFCTHPLVRKLSFTGSTRVGKVLMAQAADQVLRLSLELGGNAPFIVMDDADLDRAVRGVMDAKFRNAGQTCVCANRLLVHDTVHDAFVAKLGAAVASLKVGDGRDEGVQIGPLISPEAARRVAALVADAVGAGAQVVAEAACDAASPAFAAPCVVTGVTPAMALASSEIFGPVAAVIRVSSEAEAITIANDTPYGLAAYLFTADTGRAWRMMEALEFGMVAINDGRLSSEVAPFGGVKQSGFGREGSSHGLTEYMEIKYALLGL